MAEQRRQLPPGGAVTKDYRFEGENGPVTLAELFGDKDTLVIYSYMFGPQRERPCPMCTSLMAAWDGKVPDIEQRVALAMVARSPIERLVAAKKARGWSQLKVYSDRDGDFTRDYVSAEDADVPGYTVFTRRDGTIRHFWSGEIGGDMTDPGQDPRGAPDPDPLWTLLDTTPEGRGGTGIRSWSTRPAERLGDGRRLHAVGIVVPQPVAHHLLQQLGRPPDVGVVEVQRGEAEAHDVGGAEVADHAAGDQRLHRGVALVERNETWLPRRCGSRGLARSSSGQRASTSAMKSSESSIERVRTSAMSTPSQTPSAASSAA